MYRLNSNGYLKSNSSKVLRLGPIFFVYESDNKVEAFHKVCDKTLS